MAILVQKPTAIDVLVLIVAHAGLRLPPIIIIIWRMDVQARSLELFVEASVANSAGVRVL